MKPIQKVGIQSLRSLDVGMAEHRLHFDITRSRSPTTMPPVLCLKWCGVRCFSFWAETTASPVTRALLRSSVERPLAFPNRPRTAVERSLAAVVRPGRCSTESRYLLHF